MEFQHIVVPEAGRRIRVNADFSLDVPDEPIIPFIEGDGIGIDVTPAMRRVVDAAVAQAYGGRRRVRWMEAYAGEKANALYGQWFPPETLAALREFVVAIKGPLGTPVGAGVRSLNVAIRQELDLYANVRPIRYFPGVASPMKLSGTPVRYRTAPPTLGQHTEEVLRGELGLDDAALAKLRAEKII